MYTIRQIKTTTATMTPSLSLRVNDPSSLGRLTLPCTRTIGLQISLNGLGAICIRVQQMAIVLTLGGNPRPS